MSLSTEQFEHAYQNAIAAVGVGKRGSRPLEPILINDLARDIRQGKVPEAALGAILGALMIKGLTAEERTLEKVLTPHVFDEPKVLVDYIGGAHLKNGLQPQFIKLIQGTNLSYEESKILGRFLFGDAPGDGLRALAASIMRVRYETREEYRGLLESVQETFTPGFRQPAPKVNPVVQLAEPFDGVDQSSLVTPLVAEFLINEGYCPISLVGRNSGPKKGVTVADIAELLPTSALISCRQLEENIPPFGWHLHQKDLSPALDRWVDIRRTIIKRPFLSTIERFVNPVKADIHIASAFHAPYGEKMLDLCEDAGFPGAIIVRNGTEGSIGFPLLRPAKILCTARQKNGEYIRAELEYDSQKELNHSLKLEEKLMSVHPVKNRDLIALYRVDHQTRNEQFDLRVQATQRGLKKALDWIKEQIK